MSSIYKYFCVKVIPVYPNPGEVNPIIDRRFYFKDEALEYFNIVHNENQVKSTAASIFHIVLLQNIFSSYWKTIKYILYKK